VATMTERSTIGWQRDGDGVVILTLDDPSGTENTFNATFVRSLASALGQIAAERDEISGVVIASAKPAFFADGDPVAVLTATRADAPAITGAVRTVCDELRRLETLGRPVVAAIAGDALGDGLALALAAHHRIALDDDAIEIGMPQVRLGLMPGHGGVVRTVRLLGIAQALTAVLLQGTRHSPARAKELGLIDELVRRPEELIPAAKAWIAANPDAAQPWDREEYRMPGGTPASPKLAQFLPAFPANLRKQLKGASYPAPLAIMAAAVEGAELDFDGAITVETRYLVNVATGQVAKNMVQAFHFDLARASGGRGRPAGPPPFAAKHAVILGAGMMGAAIAYVAAAAGIEITLKDVSREAAEHGKSYSEGLLAKAVARGGTSQQQAAELLKRISPTATAAEADAADVVIEAVFEDPDVKAAALREIEPLVRADALLASNTSTLPISGLAGYVSRPADFIGLHFFSPVDKMPLLEIIKGQHTSEATLGRALDFAAQIGKTPIVVNDSRGFFTSRVITTFIYEALGMLLEGVSPSSVEQAASQAGYPTPPLALSDELNLNLLRKIRNQYKAAAQADGIAWAGHPAEALIDEMLDQHARGGRLAGAGFYDYRDGKRAALWPGLADLAPPAAPAPPLADLEERMLFIETIEAVKCRDEGVIEFVADANVGSILGIGFPAWTGGVLQFVNGYDGGPTGFVGRANELAASYGERFSPPPSLVLMAAAGERYSDIATPGAQDGTAPGS
jgi:3-hydroxyacyl-CoA dehydrogenase/enoyl-CoA hydratase/3-hydroxybutyryl-CoA epimerase